MRRILSAGALARDEVGIVFCHADVRGAYMNDGMRSREGIDIAAFPSALPIYSGHFHKPHTMTKGGCSLRYVGSPYQTSLSEAGQEKFLYCLERQQGGGSTLLEGDGADWMGAEGAEEGGGPVWREGERWQLDVGRKYHRAANLSDVATIERARAGDRVVLPVRVGEEGVAQGVADGLRRRGVEVEVRRDRLERLAMAAGTNTSSANTSGSSSSTSGGSSGESSAPSPQAAEASEMAAIADYRPQEPLALFAQFMRSNAGRASLAAADSNSTSNSTSSTGSTNNTSGTSGSGGPEGDAAREALHAQVLAEGRDTLARVMGTDAGAKAGSRISGTSTKDLHLDSVSLRNFGPFAEKLSYPLSQRGLVLIRGMSTDGTGADSNGAGKTTLAMSVLWGLTGSMDARLVADGNKVDVAYDPGPGSPRRTAEVTVKGTINTTPFGESCPQSFPPCQAHTKSYALYKHRNIRCMAPH